MKTVDVKYITYQGRPLGEVIKSLINKVSRVEDGKKASIPVKQRPVSAESIHFKSSRFRARNLRDALDECKAFLVSQIDARDIHFKKGVKVGEVLETALDSARYSFNEGMIDLLPDDIKPEEVHTVKEALDQLLMIIVRLSDEKTNNSNTNMRISE